MGTLYTQYGITMTQIVIPSVIVPITAKLVESDVKNKDMVKNEVGFINHILENFIHTRNFHNHMTGCC
jgi:hypothetical protein